MSEAARTVAGRVPVSRNASLAIAVEGEIRRLGAEARRRLLDRSGADDPETREGVTAIIADVRRRGDAALREMALRFDGVALDTLEVGRPARRSALAGLDPAVRTGLETAAAAITRYHEAQRPGSLAVETFAGVRLTRRAEPLDRVGVYAPGGRAAYPSSVLMGALPARVAGVREVMVCSPPGPGGLPSPVVLAACEIAGVDRVFSLGGAGAVAALAYGTATVPVADRVVGPGNAFVAEAKRQLNGTIGIDSPAGPSELLIVADHTAPVANVALELLAQAEHDANAAVALVATDRGLLAAVREELAARLAVTPRAGIIASALAARGALLFARDLDEALEFGCEYAPEHLLLLVADPRLAAERVRAAGTIFLGPSSSVAFGDYITGANHVLPTGRASRSFSGLSTADFLRWVTVQEVAPAAAATLSDLTATLANAENLPGHAAAARAHGTAAAALLAPRLRTAYREIGTYDPGRVPVALDLSDNTNLFGPGPAATEALTTAAPALIARYPSVYADRLRTAVAGRFGVDAANVATGCGSDDLIDSAVRAFCEPGDRVVHPAPSFGMVSAFARMNAVTPVAVPLRGDLSLDVEGLLRERATLTYLCRPNNPTGHAFARDAVLGLIARTSGVVLIDEAYADFGGDDLAAAAVASGRAVVLRTFSKAYGLAGLRVGIAIGPAGLVREIEKSRGPYKVNAVGERAALAMLEHGQDWVNGRIRETRENRDRLSAALRAEGIDALPSVANFLFVRAPAPHTALGLALGLREQGVGVRPFAELPVVGEGIRVTVGPWPMMSAFLAALRQVLHRGRR